MKQIFRVKKCKLYNTILLGIIHKLRYAKLLYIDIIKTEYGQRRRSCKIIKVKKLRQ